MSAKYIVV